MDQIDAKYDAEIEAAKGDADEVERLENEKAQKKLDIQKSMPMSTLRSKPPKSLPILQSLL